MRHDAIVIGGSFAGLAAATYLARGRRTVAVIDAGLPRNRFADHSHGFLAHDGDRPGDILAAARRQLDAYPTVSSVPGTVTEADRSADGGSFTVHLADGTSLDGRRLVLAFGLTDELPPIPGLAERWGRSVIHCPYCHGYEYAGRRLGVLDMSPASLHQAMLVAEWGPTTLFLDGRDAPDAASLAELERRGVAVEPAPLSGLHGEGETLAAVELADGRRVAIDALYIGPRARLNSDVADALGCAFEEAPFGRILRTDPTKATTVAGVFAAGDITRPAHTVAYAVADGVAAGIAAHRSLVF